MPRYQVTAPDGRTVTLEGDAPPTDADLDGIFASLPPKAETTKADPADIFKKQLATAGSFGHTPQPEEMPEGAAGKLAMAGTIASLPLGVQAAGAPLAALRGLAMSAAGASAGGYAGTGLGRGLEMVGAPEGTSETAGTIGGLVGGVAGPVGGPMALAKLLKLGGGKAGMLGQIGERLAGTGAASVEATAAKTAATAEREAAKAAEREAARKLRERALAVAEERNALTRQRLELRAAREAAKTAPKAGPRAVPKPEPAPAPRTEGATALKSEPEFIPEDAVSLVAEPLPFRPRPSKGTTTMPTNLGGKAKPGPAPTPPDKVEDALRASLKPDAKIAPAQVETALRDSVKELSAEGLQIPRIQIGAEKVGRQVGMLKEEVRQVAGPVLNEARGEASPIFPRKALESIVDKMRTIPPGPEREAYVRAATSDKAMWQVETIRRTLEKLGLLVPVGVAAGTMSE